MAKNQESINRSLFELLRSRGYAPTLLDTSGKEIPVPEEAEVFQFKFTKDGEEYGTVTASIDGLHKLVIYFGDDVANSEKEDNGGDDSWYKLLNHLKRFSQQHQLSFEVKNRDHLKYDMAKREHMKKQERIAEGYYPMGKSRSYNDNIPTVKIVIEHTRQIEEGEQRYRNVNRIFLENIHGERILAPTTKPGVAQIYARHLAEGGMPHDDRWNHIISLCEEYNKMGAFVRATRNNQFNESAQQLVNEGINHYQSLRESLSKMRGSRGYNAYFESYTPPLMEDESEENNLNELFVQETLDPRIESVMPILNKLHKKVAEMKEVNELSEWADNLIDEGAAVDAYMAGKSPALAHFADQLDNDVDEGILDTVKKVGSKVFDKLGGGSEEDLIKDLQKSAGVEVTGKKPEFDVKAKELARSNSSDPAGNFMKGGKDLGIFKEELDEARVFGYDIKRVPDLKVSYDDAQELKNQLGMLQKVMMYSTPDGMSPEIRSRVKDIYFKITKILQRNGLQESDLMSMEETLDPAHQADQKINTPAVQRKEKGGDWKVNTQDLAKADEKNMTSSAGMAALKKRMNTIEGWKGELAGGTLGGVGGTVAGSALGALAGGPIGAAVGGVIGGAAGGTGGQMVGREITKEEQLNEFGPLLAAGARAIMPLLSRVGPALGRMVSTAGKTGAEVAGKAATGIGRGTADVAKSAAGSAAQNAGKIGVGVGAYEAITDVAKGLVGGVGEVYRDAGQAAGAIAQSVGNAIDGKTIGELAGAAVKYSIPIGILLAVLYGGKKLIDQVMSEGADDSEMGALGQMVGKITPNPSDFVQGFKKTFEGQEELDFIKRLIRK